MFSNQHFGMYVPSTVQYKSVPANVAGAPVQGPSPPFTGGSWSLKRGQGAKEYKQPRIHVTASLVITYGIHGTGMDLFAFNHKNQPFMEV